MYPGRGVDTVREDSQAMKLTLQEMFDRAARKVGLVPYRVNVHTKKARPARRARAGKNGSKTR